MPATSQSQQRFMGMVRAYQTGRLKKPSPEVRAAAKSMDEEDVKHFAATKHEGLPQKVAFWGNLARWSVLPGYGAAGGGADALGRSADKDFMAANPATTSLPTWMTSAQRHATPMPAAVRAKAEASSTMGHMLDGDFNTYLTSNPASARFFSPVLGALGLYHGQPIPDILATQGGLAPPVLAGLAIKRWLPGWKVPGLAGTVGSGVGAGLAIKGNEYLQHATGLEAPIGLNDRIDESWWRPQVRGLTNLVAGATGGLVGSRNPIGAVGGAIMGAMKEPIEMHRTLSEQNANIQNLDKIVQNGRHWMLLRQLADPRVPMSSLGDLTKLPELDRDHALAMRYENAASGVFDTLGPVKPRSTWKDMNVPEYEKAPAPRTPLIESVGNEVSGLKLPATSQHAPVKTPQGEVRVPGTQDIQGAENFRSISKQLPLAGGILAAGLGLYGLRKLFGREEKEDNGKSQDYAPPSITTPDRWVRM
jgi:hypothetical protein